MPTEYSRKNKERLRKEAYEMYQNLSEEEKNLKKNMVASDIRIFLKIKKKRNVSMKVNATKIFLKIKNSRKNSGIKE